jgi:hypothetical protein
MPTNVGFKGVDVRQTGTALLLRTLLQSAAGALVTSGTTSLRLYELQSDGSLKTYDFSTNAFTAGVVTTPTASLNYQKSTNGTVDTGLWTYALTTLTGLTAGAIYLAHVNNPNASPTDQVREFQWGSAEGDLQVTPTGTGAADLNAAPDWAHVLNATTAVALSGTTFSTAQVVASVSGNVAGSVGSVAGNVSGNVVGSVGSILGITFPVNFASLSIDTGGNAKIQGAVKRNSALNGYPFYMASSADHVSPATGKAITSTVSLNGGAFAATANQATEIGGGWYALNLAAGDLNGATVALSFAAPGCDTTVLTLVTQP